MTEKTIDEFILNNISGRVNIFIESVIIIYPFIINYFRYILKPFYQKIRYFSIYLLEV